MCLTFPWKFGIGILAKPKSFRFLEVGLALTPALRLASSLANMSWKSQVYGSEADENCVGVEVPELGFASLISAAASTRSLALRPSAVSGFSQLTQ